jgi:hypothetical protein
VPNDRAFVAHEIGGGHAYARGLRGNRLADLSADRIERRQQQRRRKTEDLAATPRRRLDLTRNRCGLSRFVNLDQPEKRETRP